MFFILGISISVFLVFLLLIKKEKSSADKILLGWLILLFIHQLFNYLDHTSELKNYPNLLGLDFPMPTLHGVLLFLYVLEITGNKLKKRVYYYLHFVPAISLIILAIPFYNLTGAEKIYILDHDGIGYEWYVIYQNFVMFFSGFLYSGYSLYLIRRHQKNIQQKFSNIDKKELQWLQFLAVGLGIIWFLVLFFDSTVIFSWVVIIVLFIGFFGINQLNIFNTIQKPESEKIKLEEKKEPKELSNNTVSKRYAKSGLSKEKAEQLYSGLNQLVNEESLYKNNDLTLTELAKRLNVHPNHLSQVINEKEQKNFYNYINALRIKEFIRLASLPESKQYTLLGLAYQCGFNSKSTFNKQFKEHTGQTPSEFLKSINS